MVHPNTTCCKTSGDSGCVCAAQAKCSCGKENALHCSCNKASTENAVTGARCSCSMSFLFSKRYRESEVLTDIGSRPVGQCTCERSASENHPFTGSSCPCGARPEASCTCERADAVESAIETDFTSFGRWMILCLNNPHASGLGVRFGYGLDSQKYQWYQYHYYCHYSLPNTASLCLNLPSRLICP